MGLPCVTSSHHSLTKLGDRAMGLPSLRSFIACARSHRLPPFSKGMIAMRRSVLLVLVGLLVSAPVFAQTLGTITGEVKDSSGAVVPGVTITAVNKATNATRTASTNAAGLYDFPALQPGVYTVKSELDGFKTVTREAELQVQGTVRVNFTLEVGAISEMAPTSSVK